MLILGERLRELRLKKELKQEVIVKEFSLARATYSMYETGQRNPPLELLVKFATFYNVSTDYLLGQSDTYYPNKNVSSIRDLKLIKFFSEIDSSLDKQIMDYAEFLHSKHLEDKANQILQEGQPPKKYQVQYNLIS